jgi:hypothetical protein
MWKFIDSLDQQIASANLAKIAKFAETALILGTDVVAGFPGDVGTTSSRFRARADGCVAPAQRKNPDQKGPARSLCCVCEPPIHANEYHERRRRSYRPQNSIGRKKATGGMFVYVSSGSLRNDDMSNERDNQQNQGGQQGGGQQKPGQQGQTNKPGQGGQQGGQGGQRQGGQDK